MFNISVNWPIISIIEPEGKNIIRVFSYVLYDNLFYRPVKIF